MSESIDPHELHVRRLRLLARLYRQKAAELDMVAEAAVTAHSMDRLVKTWNAAVAQDVAQHPDLAELNAQLDGYYKND